MEGEKGEPSQCHYPEIVLPLKEISELITNKRFGAKMREMGMHRDDVETFAILLYKEINNAAKFRLINQWIRLV